MTQTPKFNTPPSPTHINPSLDGTRYGKEKSDHVFMNGADELSNARDIQHFEKYVATHPEAFEVDIENSSNGTPTASTVFLNTDDGQKLKVLESKQTKTGTQYIQHIYNAEGKERNQISRTWENFRVFDGNPNTIESKALQAELIREKLSKLDNETSDIQANLKKFKGAHEAIQNFLQKHQKSSLPKEALHEYENLLNDAEALRFQAKGRLFKGRFIRKAKKLEREAQAMLANQPKLKSVLNDLIKLEKQFGMQPSELSHERTLNDLPNLSSKLQNKIERTTKLLSDINTEKNKLNQELKSIHSSQ